MSEVLRADGLTVLTGAGVPVLDDVTVAVGPGAVLGVIGESGAGKSTLARALAGAVRPGLRHGSGSVTLGGRAVLPGGRGTRGRWVRYMPQDPLAALTPTRRIGSLLAEMVRVTGTDPAGDPAGAALAAVDLPSGRAFRRRFGHELSGGQRQRVLLALTLIGDPRAVVLDEPTSAVDAAQVTVLLERLDALRRERGLSIVLVSHDPDAIAAVATDVVVLDAGRVVGPRPVDQPAPEIRSTAAQPAGEPVPLRVRDLAISVGRGIRLLSGVDLQVAAGECVAVTGPSGLGKSTFVRALLGLHPPDSGTVEIAGTAVAARVGDRGRARRRLLGYVPQDPATALNPRRRAGDGIRRALYLSGSSPARAAELLDAVGLDPALADRYPHELSGGQCQRVALARALATDPVVLVCDEITSALDEVTAGRITSLLRAEAARRGMAVVLVSHDRRAVAAMDRVFRISDGALVADERLRRGAERAG